MSAITLPLPTPFSTRVVNCYLLEGPPLTLVDPGPDWDETAVELEAALARRGRRVEDVEEIVLTHQHSDHVGLAHTLRERSGARVIAPDLLSEYLAVVPVSLEEEDRYGAEVMRLHGVAEPTIDLLYQTSKEHRRYVGSVVVDRTVGDGDVIELGGRPHVVHSRPGHSPTDTIFVDEPGRVAFVGDHLIAHISSNPVIHRPLSRPADPRARMRALPAYIESLQRTAALELDRLLPGHGGEVTEHRVLVGERLEFHRRRKERIFAGFEGRPCTAHELALGLWQGIAEREAFLTLSETLGHLDLLEDEGRVEWSEEGGVVRYVALGAS